MPKYEIISVDLYDGGYVVATVEAESPAHALHHSHDEEGQLSYYKKNIKAVGKGKQQWKLKEEETLYIIRAV